MKYHLSFGECCRYGLKDIIWYGSLVDCADLVVNLFIFAAYIGLRPIFGKISHLFHHHRWYFFASFVTLNQLITFSSYFDQDIVVGTPGRLKDLIVMGVCQLQQVSFVVSNWLDVLEFFCFKRKKHTKLYIPYKMQLFSTFTFICKLLMKLIGCLYGISTRSSFYF